MRLNAKLIGTLLAVCAVVQPVSVFGMTLHGRLGGSIYSRSDDASAHEYTITRMRLKLDASDFAGKYTTMNFSGSVRSAGNDYNSDIPAMRIDTAKITMRRIFKRFDISLGRDYIDEVLGARVDGFNLKYFLSKNSGLGLFGGLMPDPYEDSFNGDYTTYGAYAFMRKAGHGFNGGFVSSMYEGSEDLSYIYASGYYIPSRSSSFYGSLRSDNNIDDSSYELTNLLLSMDYRISRRARFHLSYNQYRAVRLYESMEYSLNHELQKSFRIYANVNVTRTLKVYARVDARTRESDGKSASLYSVGVKKSSLFEWMFAELSYRSINYFTSQIMQIYGAIGADLGEKTTVELTSTYMTNDQDGIDNSLTQWIYAASVDWFASSKLYLSGSVEMSSEKYLDIDSVYMKKASDEYNSTSVYLQAGYRF